MGRTFKNGEGLVFGVLFERVNLSTARVFEEGGTTPTYPLHPLVQNPER